MTFLVWLFYFKNISLTQLHSLLHKLFMITKACFHLFFVQKRKATGSIRGTCSELGMKPLVCTQMALRLFFFIEQDWEPNVFVIGQFK